MSTEIYYFSGTGNSLYAAREIQKRVPDSNLTPIVRLLRNGPIQSNAEVVGLVFPNFCLTVPIPVHDFLAQAVFSSTRYIFAVCTRGGSPSQAFDYLNALLRKQGKRLDAQLNITMPWNHPVGKENLTGQNTPERIDRLEAVMREKLDWFCSAIGRREAYLEPDTDADMPLPAVAKVFDRLLSRSFNYESHRYMYQQHVSFFADAKCKGCGVCEKVCLSGKIALVDGKPAWKKAVPCYACFACINFCAQRAIQVKSSFLVDSHSAENPRYHHPSVTYLDIAEQR